MKEVRNIIIILLVIAVGTFLFISYWQRNQVTAPATKKTAPSPTPTSPGSAQLPKVTPEEVIANLPNANTTPAEQEIFLGNVNTLAVESGTLTINKNCTVQPMILKIKKNNRLMVKNTDSVQHTIDFQDNSLLLSANGGTKEVLMGLKGNTIHGFECDSKIGGLFYIYE